LQHGDEEVAERLVVIALEGEVLAVLEASAGEEDGEVGVVVDVGVAEVAAVEDHGAVEQALVTGNARALAGARRTFMKAHGRVFWILGIMQHFWYANDKRRESFVKICRDKDVQRLTWQSYMNKELVRSDPMAHVRIFFKDLAHLFGFVRS
jgi:hypothetical protein